MARVYKDGSYLIMIIYRVFLAKYKAGEISKLRNLRFFTVIVKSYFRISPQNDLRHFTPHKNPNYIHVDNLFCARLN
jgi:hypothetical protein